LAGAGALRSTVADLLRFLALQLSPPSTRLGRAAQATHEPRAGRGRLSQKPGLLCPSAATLAECSGTTAAPAAAAALRDSSRRPGPRRRALQLRMLSRRDRVQTSRGDQRVVAQSGVCSRRRSPGRFHPSIGQHGLSVQAESQQGRDPRNRATAVAPIADARIQRPRCATIASTIDPAAKIINPTVAQNIGSKAPPGLR
jgi:hypothetical protein